MAAFATAGANNTTQSRIKWFWNNIFSTKKTNFIHHAIFTCSGTDSLPIKLL
jgi:hypothetical protein